MHKRISSLLSFVVVSAHGMQNFETKMLNSKQVGNCISSKACRELEYIQNKSTENKLQIICADNKKVIYPFSINVFEKKHWIERNSIVLQELREDVKFSHNQIDLLGLSDQTVKTLFEYADSGVEWGRLEKADQQEIIKILEAADYLQINPLLTVGIEALTNQITNQQWLANWVHNSQPQVFDELSNGMNHQVALEIIKKNPEVLLRIGHKSQYILQKLSAPFRYTYTVSTAEGKLLPMIPGSFSGRTDFDYNPNWAANIMRLKRRDIGSLTSYLSDQLSIRQALLFLYLTTQNGGLDISCNEILATEFKKCTPQAQVAMINGFGLKTAETKLFSQIKIGGAVLTGCATIFGGYKAIQLFGSKK